MDATLDVAKADLAHPSVNLGSMSDMPTLLPTYVQLPRETGESALAIDHGQNLLGKLVGPLDDDHFAGVVPSNNLSCQFTTVGSGTYVMILLSVPWKTSVIFALRSMTINGLTINCGKSAKIRIVCCCMRASRSRQSALVGCVGASLGALTHTALSGTWVACRPLSCGSFPSLASGQVGEEAAAALGSSRDRPGPSAGAAGAVTMTRWHQPWSTVRRLAHQASPQAPLRAYPNSGQDPVE